MSAAADGSPVRSASILSASLVVALGLLPACGARTGLDESFDAAGLDAPRRDAPRLDAPLGPPDARDAPTPLDVPPDTGVDSPVIGLWST